MDIRKHDFKALEILELLQRKNIPINAWIHQDRDKDTPLMEAVRAQLLECSKFIINLLKCHNHDLLQGQLSHQSNTGQDVFQLITSARFLDKMLNESNMIPTLIDIARFHIDDAIKINSPTAQE
ncbi:Ankyrin repeat-containing protein [Rickettsia prowazekii str. GvF12]|nr:Ankyrin repeat-containing protein [Rickettsia prowazekii str. GvF12]